MQRFLMAMVAVLLCPMAGAQRFTDADELLDAVEASDGQIRELTAGIQYHRIFELAGDEQNRLGSLQFVSIPASEGAERERRFAVKFDTVIVGGRKETDGRTFVFDGEWLIERIPADRLMLKRQVAPPGSDFDPLKVGEGPLPLPLGQAKADILKSYDVTMPEAADGLGEREDSERLIRFVAETMHASQLRLIPKDDDDQFEEIRLWYSPGETGVLPCMAMTINRTGDEVVVQLVNVQLNDEATIDESAFDSEAPAGWDLEVTPFRGSAAGLDAPLAPVLGIAQPEDSTLERIAQHLDRPQGGDIQLLDQRPMPATVAALIGAPYTTDEEAAALRVFHGQWTEADLASPELAAACALARGAFDDPVFLDEGIAAHVRAEAAIGRGELDAALGLLAGDGSYRAVRLRVQALEQLGRHDEALAATEVAVDRLLRETSEDAGELTDAVLTLIARARLAGPERADGTDFQTLMALLSRASGELDRLYWPAKLAEAELLYSKDERGRAAEAAQDVVSLNPSCARAWALLGRLSVDSFEFDQAEAIAARLDALASTDDAWWSGRGGTMPEADLPSVLGGLVIARTRIRQDAPGDGIRLVTDLLEAYPGQRELLASLAALHAANYDDASRDRVLAELDEISPGTETGYLEAGWALSERRQYGDAAAMLEEAIGRQPNRPDGAIQLGLLELQSGRDLNALAALRRVSELDPFNARALNSLKLLEELVTYDTIESEHFVVRYRPGVDGVLAREMPAALERIHDRVTGAEHGGIDHEPSQKTVIELMPDHAWFAVRIAGMPRLHTIAAATGPVIAMEAPRVGPGHKVGVYDWRRTLQHEYVHTVTLSRTSNRLPHWFTEAAAQYLEDAPRDERTCRLLASRLRSDELFGMDEINIRFTRPREPEDRSLAYAQGHWMYEYMVERFGDDAPRRLMDSYARGEREGDAMVSELGIDREAFLADFKVWATERARGWGLVLNEGVPGVAEFAERDGLTEAPDAAQLDEWLDAYPGHPEIIERSVLLRIESEQPIQDRAAMLETWADAVPVAERPHRELARLWLAADEKARAVPHLEFLDERAQYTPAYAAALATHYAETGDAGAALVKAERAVSIAPYDADQRELAARVAIVAGELDTAERHLEALTELEPDRAEHTTRLARLRSMREDR